MGLKEIKQYIYDFGYGFDEIENALKYCKAFKEIEGHADALTKL